MIFGYFHEGSGLGNQIHRYVMTRVIAADKGYEWGMYQPQNYKGNEFLPLDMGKPVEINTEYKPFVEKEVRDANGVDIRGYDPEVNFITDWTALDGEFQDERYFGHRLDEIDSWLKVEPLDVPDDVCVIGFRGGEYYAIPGLGLPAAYYYRAMDYMIQRYPHIRFEVHTDDPYLAKQFFPDLPIIGTERISHSKHSNMGLNWRAMRHAKHAIIANSSFYILPRLLSKGTTIAPRYWARHEAKTWALPQNYYKSFTYL